MYYSERATVSPFFSVIIPVYNKERQVSRAVSSVLCQSFTDYEIIVVDDGSTDNSLAALRHFKADNIRVICQPNMGGAGGQARNTAMEAGLGIWFAFLDADDVWMPDHLQQLYNIASHALVPALISTQPVELQDGAMYRPVQNNKIAIKKVNYFLEASQCIGHLNCSSSAIHRDIYSQLGGFVNVRSGPDLEYWARIALEFPVFKSNAFTSIYFRGNMGNMEQIAAQSLLSNPPIPLSLEDVSPSLEMLVFKSKQDPSILRRSDIRVYINSRLKNGMRIYIRSSTPCAARQMYSLIIQPSRDFSVTILGLVALLPDTVLRFSNLVFGVCKPLLSSIFSRFFLPERFNPSVGSSNLLTNHKMSGWLNDRS